MIKYTLPTGKTIEIPARLFFDLTEDEFADEIHNLVALDLGTNVEDPFYDSVLYGEKTQADDDRPGLNDFTELDEKIGRAHV